MTVQIICNVKICNEKALDDFFCLCREHYKELLP